MSLEGGDMGEVSFVRERAVRRCQWGGQGGIVPLPGEALVGGVAGHVIVQREPSRLLRNGRKVAAGRGEAKISASIMDCETPTT